MNSEPKIKFKRSDEAFKGQAVEHWMVSGKAAKRMHRHACHHGLRTIVHLWANTSRYKCAWAQAYYQVHRANSKSTVMVFV